MKIKFYGFEWILGKGISLDEFCKYLNSKSGLIIGDRMMAVIQKDGYWAGLLLSIKDMKAFCTLKRGSRSFKISQEQLEDNANMAAFNFFIIHPATARGLYQHYHQSASINTFCNFCKGHYEKLKRDKIDKAIADAGGDSISDSMKQDQKKKFKGSLTYSAILRGDSFEKYVNDLKNIKVFKYEYSALVAKDSGRSPLTKYADREVFQAFFSKNAFLPPIKDSIVSMVANKILRKARIEGVDPEGNYAAYKLLHDYDPLAEYEYDEVIKTIDIDSNELEKSLNKSYMVNELLFKAKSPGINAILTTPVAP